MTPPPLVSILNQSTLITDHDCAMMVRAVGSQLAHDVSPLHGLVPALEFVQRGGRPNGAPCYLLDDPDVDGALGYHDEDQNGMPFIKVFARPTIDNGGTSLTGSSSVSVTLSHELLELVGDGPANKWVDGPDGNDYAYELCDAVEGDAYSVGGVSVSNFLFPAFFDPKASKGSKLDFLGKLTVPFGMTPGGYQIQRTEPGVVNQIFAMHTKEGRHAYHAANGVFVVFGPQFPQWRRQYKMRHLTKRAMSKKVATAP